MADTLWTMKREILQTLQEKEYLPVQSRFQFYHYTSLSALFSILDSDSLWASNVRFSNDSMEEKMLGKAFCIKDDYIICFCSENDVLSQWRGYCYNGGAAIKLDLREPADYSILQADYDTSRQYKIYENAPLPIVYVSPQRYPQQRVKNLEKILSSENIGKSIEMEEIAPYLKNGKFYEEKESRLVFSNVNGDLSKCIRFRTLQNGVKVPYIVIKNDNIGKMNGNCLVDIKQFTDDKLCWHKSMRRAIWVPEGMDQESKYYEISSRIDQYETENPNEQMTPLRVYCRGHLPIEEITVAPTYDSDRIVEQIERFCMSKYWLRRVKVKKSEIPYIRPMV